MKKITIIAIVAILIVLAAVLIYRYYNVTDAEWMMGRHYTEIVERYGDFDNPEFVDGKFDTLPAEAYYVVKPERPHRGGLLTEEREEIYLDESGKARSYEYCVYSKDGKVSEKHVYWNP